MSNKTRNIFVGLSGLSPQVITETIYCICCRNRESLDEIFVVTTEEGKTKLGPVNAKLEEMECMYHVNIPRLDSHHILTAAEETVTLSDVKTTEDNRFFPNMLTAFIRKLTEDPNTTLHCSVAGGRKTMSVSMGFAMMLFGRSQDRLTHVVAAPEIERNRNKFFPETEEEDKLILLADVPFVRLREKLGADFFQNAKTYAEMVSLAQKQLISLSTPPRLTVDLEARSLTIGNISLRLKHLDMAIYCFFLRQHEAVHGGKQFINAHREEILELYCRIRGRSTEYEKARKSIVEKADFGIISKSIAEIRKALKKHFGGTINLDLYEIFIDASGGYANKKYGIRLDRKLVKWKK